MALVTQPDDWLGGVAWVPMADHKAAYETANAHFKAYWIHFFNGTPDEQPALYKKCSPMTHIDQLKAPLLIIHGENDPRCPANDVKRFYEEAKGKNLPVELIMEADEGHGSDSGEGNIRNMMVSIEHLRNVLHDLDR